ncbi:MAG: METTL5 family protein [Candidatus Hodarchaeota archaeon]
MNINKKDLISIIQNTQAFSDPQIELEQYCIDAISAVDIIYFAGFEFDDITNQVIIDLGAGTGRLSIASAFLKAKYILSVDIDCKALKILKKNVDNLELNNIIFPICAEIGHFELNQSFLNRVQKITTIMNPPFGVKKKKADRIFLEKAFSFSSVIYSIHLANEEVSKFIRRYIKKYNWSVNYIFPLKLTLERSFHFHKKRVKNIDVNIYRFTKDAV